MADRRRGIFDFLRRSNEPQIIELPTETKADIDWDRKALASMTKIGINTSFGSGAYPKKEGADQPISYSLIKQIANKSEIVNAIVRRCVDDTIANGYEFVLDHGVEEGSDEQLKKVRAFFREPNPDDMGDEWLESLLFDLVLFGDAYLELDGSEDRSSKSGEDWNFGGDLTAIWPIPSETMKLVPANQTPKPPNMAYVQEISGNKRRFSSEKIIHIAKFKQGRGYGQSPLIPLLETISGQLSLSNYMNALYTGTLPKTILNVGDISNSEMKSMLALIEQQLAGGKSPFGLIAINGGTGFNMHRLLDTTREGAQLDLLYYYREEICAVFGIPPMKLGWVQTGKLANPEQQLDSWYDVVESYHARVSAMINNKILPKLGISDWKFKFITIRPSRDNERAEAFGKRSNAVSILRQEAAISINEARQMLELPFIMDDRANDPFFMSPKLMINAGAGEVSSDDDPEGPDLLPEDTEDKPQPIEETHPAPAYDMDGYGKDAGDFPQFTEAEIQYDIGTFTDEQISMMTDSELNAMTESIEQIESNYVERTLATLSFNQKRFADQVIGQILGKLGGSGIEEEKSIRVNKALDPDDVDFAIDVFDGASQDLLDQNLIAMGEDLKSGYGATISATALAMGVDLSFTRADEAALQYWQRRWQVPALRNTLGAYRGQITTIMDQANRTGKNWDWVAREMRRTIDPTGTKYPSYWYDRIARTEVRRVVENAHLSAAKKLGFSQAKRLVTVDSVTDKDLCLPFENAIYPIDKSGGVLPAHPNCRCSFAVIPPEGKPSIPDDQILKPEVEGAEILDLDQ